MLFYVTKFVAVCYNSNRTLTQLWSYKPYFLQARNSVRLSDLPKDIQLANCGPEAGRCRASVFLILLPADSSSLSPFLKASKAQSVSNRLMQGYLEPGDMQDNLSAFL